MHKTYERPCQQLLLPVPDDALERWIDASQGSVEPRDLEQIKRLIEQPHQFAVERLTRLPHPRPSSDRSALCDRPLEPVEAMR